MSEMNERYQCALGHPISGISGSYLQVHSLLSVTWKPGLGKPGLGKQSFLQKSLEKQRNSQTYVKNNTKYVPKATGAAFGGAPRGRRFAPPPWVVVFAYMLYDFSTIFCCFSMFFNDFCRKDWFPRPLLSRPLLGVTDIL